MLRGEPLIIKPTRVSQDSRLLNLRVAHDVTHFVLVWKA
jgi:hypothetical protein